MITPRVRVVLRYEGLIWGRLKYTVGSRLLLNLRSLFLLGTAVKASTSALN